jgi:hypothetical protein
MDIKEKRITIQIYLNTGPDAASLGTDLYRPDKSWHSRAEATSGKALVFLSREPESWHGFEKRAAPSLRRSLIVNYVSADWRSRHELSFPDAPIPGGGMA